jgi:hypothetical protein
VADTGLPWELPYPLPTDLVRDGADAIKDLAEATATGLSAAGNAGIGSNVVQTTKTNSFSTTVTGPDGADITGFDATITPSSNTAKILVIASGTLSQSTSGTTPGFGFRLKRGTTFIADSSDNHVYFSQNAADRQQFQMTAVFLDSPASATAVTYTGVLRAQASGTAVFGGRGDGAATSFSSLTLIEVAP